MQGVLMRLYEVRVRPKSRTCRVKLYIRAESPDGAIDEIIDSVEGLVPAEITGPPDDPTVAVGTTSRNVYDAAEAIETVGVMDGRTYRVRKDECWVKPTGELWISANGEPTLVVLLADENGVSTEQLLVIPGG
jgi:hypothetical protein